MANAKFVMQDENGETLNKQANSTNAPAGGTGLVARKAFPADSLGQAAVETAQVAAAAAVACFESLCSSIFLNIPDAAGNYDFLVPQICRVREVLVHVPGAGDVLTTYKVRNQTAGADITDAIAQAALTGGITRSPAATGQLIVRAAAAFTADGQTLRVIVTKGGATSAAAFIEVRVTH